MYSHLRKVMIPSGLKHMLEGFSRAVVRCKPTSIPHFAEQYFKALLSFRDENPNLNFYEVLKQFQQSQLPVCPSSQTVHRVKSKEWEAGPLIYEARIDQSGHLPRFPPDESSETVREDAQGITNAQFFTSENVEAEIEQSDLDGIISANVITLSPGPITPEMAVDLAVFRRRTTPKSSVHNSCGSSPTGERSYQGSPCRHIRSALFERVPLNDIGMDVDAVLIKTSVLPNVTQIVVQSEEVPEVIVFQADVKLTDRGPGPAFTGMEAVRLNEENTSSAPALFSHCGLDTGDTMAAKTSESVELITSKSLVESFGDQGTVETKIDSASQRSKGSASQHSSQTSIAVPVNSHDEQIPVEMKESASQKSSAQSIGQHSTVAESQITSEASDENQITCETCACENHFESASLKSSTQSIGAHSTADEKQITSKASACENLDSASHESLLSNMVIAAVSSVCDDQAATTEVPDVAESFITKDTAESLEVQTESESKGVNQDPEVSVQEASVLLNSEASSTDLTAITSVESPTAEVALEITNGTLGSQTTLLSQEVPFSNLGDPDVLVEAITEGDSPFQACEAIVAEGKASLSDMVTPPSVPEGKVSKSDMVTHRSVAEGKDSKSDMVMPPSFAEGKASKSDMVTHPFVAEGKASNSDIVTHLSVAEGKASKSDMVTHPFVAEGKASNSGMVTLTSGAVEEAESPEVPTDVLAPAGSKTELSGAESIHLTGIISPLAADCEVQEDKAPASAQANGAPSVEIRAPYLVYLPLPPVEMLTPAMVPQVAAEGEEAKASPYVYIPVATGDLMNNPSFVAATTPQLSRTGSFAGPFVPLAENQRGQCSAQPSRPASQGHLGFPKIRRPLSHSPAVVSMAAEGVGSTTHPSASSQHQAGASNINIGQQPISCCSCGKLQNKPSEPTVASVCPCIGSASNWRLCHLTHPGSQSGHQLPCFYQPSSSMPQCGLEHIAKIPMYQDCGLYCNCHHHHMLRTSRPSCSNSSPRLHHMAEPTCSGHALGPFTARHGCSSEHVCGNRVLPPSAPPATDRHYPCCWRASCAPLQPRHSSLVMCDHHEMIGHGNTYGGACGHTKATTVPSCLHQSAGPETCHDYRANYNL